MDEPGSLLGYVAVAALVALTPGPNLALVIRTTLASGIGGGARATLGIGLGLGAWAAAAALGIAAVLAASPVAFAVLQAAGGAWLIFLGVRAWLASARMADGQPGPPASGRRDFQAGLVTVLLNPLAGAFYLAALPGFVEPGGGAVATTLGLAAIHIGVVLVWMMTCSVLVARGGRAFGPTTRRLVTRATAVVLVVFGIRALLAVVTAATGS